MKESAVKNIITRALRHYHETGDDDFYIGSWHIMIGLDVLYVELPGALNYAEFPLDY